MKKVLFLVLFFITPIFGQIKSQNFVDKNKVFIGDIFVYNIILEYPSEFKLEEFDIYSVLKSTEGKENFMLYEKKYNIKTKKRYVREAFMFKLIPLQIGKIKILELNINLIDKNTNETKQVFLPSLEVEVLPYPKPKNKKFDGEIVDIKGQIWVKNYFWIILILFLVLGIIIYISYQYKLKPNVTQSQIVQEIDIKETAFKKLEELWRKNYIELGLIKEFYLELTEVVRWYIEKKYNVNALELTTEELFGALKKKVEKKYNLELKAFLENADLAKFAKYVPEKKQILEDFETAKRLIK